MVDQGPPLISYLHPAAALLAIGWLGFVASLGLRSRDRGGAHLRPRHARLAPIALVAIVATAAWGAVSTRFWRPDLEAGAGWHVRLAIAEVAILISAAVLSRRIATSARARVAHPLLGLLALLIALLQIFFGLALIRF